jgi:hypothetical protein
MPEQAVHPDVLAFAEAMAYNMRANFATELAELFADPVNIRTLASDRWTPLIVPVRTDRPVEAVSASLDRARVAIYNPSSTVTVALGNSNRLSLTGAERFDLAPGTGLVLATRGAVWALAATAVDLSVTIEQWDAVRT